ncbi:hypothetical protein [Marivita sp. GX14005]|uniref:hypothetical protein n=1 Tax=Marivita sp. GX14005 TaxID=2942276 RepID=UPI0020199B94|nr:hypothetical protein [Marivita sp. GX14005]MCL3881694.1 hypothetical protein [Marivita sp. GX14005]
MKKTAGLTKAQEVLQAQADKLFALRAEQRRMSRALHEREREMTEQARALHDTLHEDAVRDPAMFRFRELRLQKLSRDLRSLKPGMNRAAQQGEAVQAALKGVMRKQLGVSLMIEQLDAEAPVFETEAQRLQTLFEMKKRR